MDLSNATFRSKFPVSGLGGSVLKTIATRCHQLAGPSSSCINVTEQVSQDGIRWSTAMALLRSVFSVPLGCPFTPAFAENFWLDRYNARTAH